VSEEYKSINVVLYGYKDKNVFNCIKTLLDNKSGKHFIFVHLQEQHPLDRSKQFADLINSYNGNNGAYVHIFWDLITGTIEPKDIRLKATVGGKYHLSMYSGVQLEKDWDDKLINFVDNNNAIVSGNKQIKIKNKNLFYIDKEYSDVSDFEITNFVDRNFIFGEVKLMKTSLLGTYMYPAYLKYYGEEETLSLQYFKDKIPVFAAPESIVKIDRYNTIEDFNVYVPFSLNHNYNEVISLFKNGKNKFVNIDMDIVKEFNKFHNFNFDSLEYLPFPTNDVDYDMRSSGFDRLDGSRFVKQLKKID
jgi:hypothetical protein